MKTLCSTILFLLIAGSSFSQTTYIENLKKRLSSNTLPDTDRVLVQCDLAYATAFTRPDTGIAYVQQSMELASKINFVRGQVVCKYAMGQIMWIVGEFSNANDLLLQVLKYAKSVNDMAFQMGILSALSVNERDQGNYETALEYSFKALEFAESSANFKFHLALCYLENGAIYQETNKPDSALYYFEKVNMTDPDDAGFMGFKYLMTGRTYAKMGQDTLALKFYALSIQTLSHSNNLKDFAGTYTSLAEFYKKKQQTDSSIYYAKKGFDIAQKGEFKKGILEAGLFLSKIYEETDPTSSLKYFKIATAAKDSMFNLQKSTQILSSRFNEQIIYQQEEATRTAYHNKIRTYGLLAALGVFFLIAALLYRNNLHKQKAKVDIEKAYEHLKTTQAQLIQSEKMASLGELTAGIAHEIQNPLNFVNNFSDVNKELIEEIKAEINKGNWEEVKAIADDIESNEVKINHHGKRADAIVKGMLQHSRSSSGIKEATDINALANEYLRLSFHGLRAKDKSFNASIITDFDPAVGKINVIPQDIGRVLLNLYNNSFYAVAEKKKQQPDGYEPTVTVSTHRNVDFVEIKVRDNGVGIPEKVVGKIFQPFFTTKPTGQGTGLGLSLSYEAIKSQGGTIKVESKEGEGALFILQFPL